MLDALRALGPSTTGVTVPPSLTLLPVQASCFGYELREDDGSYRHDGSRRQPPAAVLQYTIAGAGAVHYEGRELSVRAGQLLLLHWPHPHCYYLPSGGAWEFVYAIVAGADALRLLRGVEEERGPVVELGDGHPVAQRLLELVHAALAGAIPDALTASEGIYPVLTGLIRECRAAAREHPQAAAVAAAMAWARPRLHLDIGTVDLARVAGLTRSHFSRVFRRVTGDPPSAWLAAERLGLAMLLLREGQDLAQVARRCGFASANSFGKVFRRAVGISPGQFRTTQP